MKRNYNEDKQP